MTQFLSSFCLALVSCVTNFSGQDMLMFFQPLFRELQEQWESAVCVTISLSVRRSICLHGRVYMCIHVYLSVKVRALSWEYLCLQVCVHVHTRVCVCVGKRMCTYMCSCVCECACVHACVRVCMCIKEKSTTDYWVPVCCQYFSTDVVHTCYQLKLMGIIIFSVNYPVIITLT